MSFVWLVVWLIWHTPQIQMFGSWNSWGIALGVCIAIDLIGALGANGWRQRPYYQGFGRTWESRSGWKTGEPTEQQ
jgi:hypothetical protein